MAASVVDTVQAQLEQVRPILAQIFETSDQISSLFKKNSSAIKNVNRWLYRIPLQQFRGGVFRKYSANGGSLGRGTGMLITSLQAGFFYSILMYEVSDEQEDESASESSSIANIMSKTLADGMMEAAVTDDQCYHTDGTGILTNSSSAVSSTTMTFADATDTLGVSRLRAGMACDVWDSTGDNKRALGTGAPLIINTIDDVNQVVTFNQTVSGITTGDIIAFAEMDAYGPATLESFTAGWPATGALTTSGGLTNDSFRHGIYYAHNFSNSNYYLGKLKSSLPAISPYPVDCGGARLSWAHGFALLDRIQKRRSQTEADNISWIFPMAQRQVVFESGVAISTKMINGDQFGKSLDLAPSNNGYNEPFNYVNRPAYVSKRQYNDRVDAVNFKNWGRAEVFPLRPYKKRNGDTVFEGRDTNGVLAAYSQFGFQAAYDPVCFDPGCEGAIYGAEVPANY